MTDKELDEIAGEYVLGTLDGTERSDAQRRIQNDPEFAERVREWEQRLSHVSDQNSEIAPPSGLWQKISNELASLKNSDAPQPVDASQVIAEVFQLEKSRNRWRSAAIGAMALAASFIGLQAAGIYLPFLPKQAPEGRFVAVLNPSGSNPGFLIRVDVATRRLDIERIAEEAPRGKDYELWIIEPDEKPKSLNVVGRDKLQKVNYQSKAEGEALTFAVTLEPEGGSPTGVATGPIVFSGKLFTAQ